jgi:hypothetical protein
MASWKAGETATAVRRLRPAPRRRRLAAIVIESAPPVAAGEADQGEELALEAAA